ncbi:MarR family winged helix-turn-helix transcriptional regulator [Jeotgalibaca arthritidis]|uniref:MarR family transcriptional regulator n=1 Tax=Jeotgalibaca arthritidis TaxID=1868794 RepID=A0A6G7K9Z6_9LACT|nr:MarR family transcriptional regulator [Jeotgalibaca arthritidis]QII82067.1 MarR family transcriptional regulator [Jeotgalibaca arthritidis]
MDDSIFDRRLEDQLCFRLYRASSELGKLYSQALQPFGLTFSQYLVLLALWDKDGVAVTDIGSRTGMGIGTLNPILKRMTEHGWVEKKTHDTDKRATLVFVTEQATNEKPAINLSILKQLEGFQLMDLDIIGLMDQLETLQQQLKKVND